MLIIVMKVLNLSQLDDAVHSTSSNLFVKCIIL